MKTKSRAELSDLQTAIDHLAVVKSRLLAADEPALAMLASSLTAKAKCAAAQARRTPEGVALGA